MGRVDRKGFSVPGVSESPTGSVLVPHLQSPPCPAPRSSPLPEFGSAGLGWGQLFAASQVTLMVQGTHFENPLLQGKFLGTYWSTQPVPQGRRWAPPLSEFLGVLKDVLTETPLGSLSWRLPGQPPPGTGWRAGKLTAVSLWRAGAGPLTQALCVGYLIGSPRGGAEDVPEWSCSLWSASQVCCPPLRGP